MTMIKTVYQDSHRSPELTQKRSASPETPKAPQTLSPDRTFFTNKTTYRPAAGCEVRETLRPPVLSAPQGGTDDDDDVDDDDDDDDDDADDDDDDDDDDDEFDFEFEFYCPLLFYQLGQEKN